MDVTKQYKGPVISQLDLPLTTFDIPQKEFQEINKDNGNLEALYSRFVQCTFKNASAFAATQ